MAGDATAALARVPVLARLDAEELEQVGLAFKEHVFPAGSCIMHEGARGARVLSFFVITEGTVAIEIGGAEVRRLGPGEHVGEIGLLENVPRTATVTAETVVRCLGLSAWDFRALVERHPAIGAQLAAVASERLADDADA